MDEALRMLQDGYTADYVARKTGLPRSRVQDGQRVLGHLPHANIGTVYPVYDLLEDIEFHLKAGRPRQWVARFLDMPHEAVNSADRFMGVGGGSLRSWSLKTYDWVEELLAQELTYKEITEITRCSYPSIVRWFPGGKPKSSSWGSHREPHDWEDVEKLVKAGHTAQGVSEELNMPLAIVRVALWDIGYPKNALE